jgi:exodeoxyribonuclease VII large subunit
LKVDRLVRSPAGAGAVSQQREALRDELAAAGLLGRQRALTRLPLAPVRVGIVAGGAGTVGYTDAVTVLQQSGHQVEATHFPAPLEGEAAPARIAAQIRNAGVGSQVILVARGGGEDAQLSPFDSAPVVTAIANAPVPVITGIGHSHHDTLADAAAWQACVSPAAGSASAAAAASSRHLRGRRPGARGHQGRPAAHGRRRRGGAAPAQGSCVAGPPRGRAPRPRSVREPASRLVRSSTMSAWRCSHASRLVQRVVTR